MNGFVLLSASILVRFSAAQSGESGLQLIDNISLVNYDMTYYLHWNPIFVDDDGRDIKYNVSASYREFHINVLTSSKETACVVAVPIPEHYYKWTFRINAISDGLILATGEKSFPDLTPNEVPMTLSSPQMNVTVRECGNIYITFFWMDKLTLYYPKVIVRYPCLFESCELDYVEKTIEYQLGDEIATMNPQLPSDSEYCIEAKQEIDFKSHIYSDWKEVCTKTGCSDANSVPANRVTFISATVTVCAFIVAVIAYLTKKYCWNPLHEEEKSLPLSTKAVIAASMYFQQDLESYDWNEETANTIEPFEHESCDQKEKSSDTTEPDEEFSGEEFSSETNHFCQDVKDSETSLIIISQCSKRELDAEYSKTNRENREEAYVQDTTTFNEKEVIFEEKEWSKCIMGVNMTFEGDLVSRSRKEGDPNVIEPIEDIFREEYSSDADRLLQGIRGSEAQLSTFSQCSEIKIDINSSASEDNQVVCLPDTTVYRSNDLISKIGASLNYVPEACLSLMTSDDVISEVRLPYKYAPEIAMSTYDDNLHFDPSPWNMTTLPIYL